MFIKIAILAIIWVVLREEYTVVDLAIGVAISIACVAYSKKFLPLQGIKNVNFLRILFYVFYLIWQIYMAGFHVVKLIISGKARCEILSSNTRIDNNSLKVILMESITLTPGSVVLDLDDDIVTIIYLAEKDEVINSENKDEKIFGELEERLLKCQKNWDIRFT